jgi:predicted transcriptional regulator
MLMLRELVTIRMGPELRQMLRDVARQRNETLSTVVRRALADGLAGEMKSRVVAG